MNQADYLCYDSNLTNY